MFRFSFVLIHRVGGIWTSRLAEGLSRVCSQRAPGATSCQRPGSAALGLSLPCPCRLTRSVWPQDGDQLTKCASCHVVPLEQALLTAFINSRSYGRKQRGIYKDIWQVKSSTITDVSSERKRGAPCHHSTVTWALTRSSCVTPRKRNLKMFKHFFSWQQM